MNAFVAIGILVLVLAVPLALIGWLLARWFRSRGITGELLEAKLSQSPAGHWQAFSIRGVPVRLHWSLPLAGLVISVFAGFHPLEAVYYSVGFVLLIAMHELGHVLASWFLGLRVIAVEISAFGGQCRGQMPRTAGQAFLVYSAGIAVQLVLLLVSLVYWRLFGMPEASFFRCLLQTFVLLNLILILGNLAPSRSQNGFVSDGYFLWKLFLHAIGKARYPFPEQFGESRVLPPETRLVDQAGFMPEHFRVGIGVLNDERTPMEFVVGVLVKHLRMDREKAIEAMLAIHRKGGLLLPLASLEEAEAVARGIAADAREQGHHLVCRAEVRASAGS